jgi:DNA-binding LacI/PurR family transcriptional regulator
MNFDHPQMKKLISKIPTDKLLIIDWNIHSSVDHSYVCQDFGESVHDLLLQNIENIRKYRRFIYLYPEKLTFHPKVSIDNFKRFCVQNGISHEVQYDSKFLTIEKGDLYLLVSDRTLALMLDKIHENGFEMGSEVGIISYNETPMKKYVKSGISVISTDFNLMGKLAAEFVISGEHIRQTVPTTIIHRASF